MTKNMGIIDRTARLVAAALITVLYFADVIAGTLAVVLGAFATVFFVTSIVGYCALYVPFGISTRKDAHISPARPLAGGGVR